MPRTILAVLAILPVLEQVDAATLTVDVRGGANHVDIQAAIDAANDGDTVLVKPGEYMITEPITFKGKALTVRGEAGPEATTVRMAEVPADPGRASVVIFEHGETNAAILEGLTITGGRGWSYGGGVCCWGSSPTVTNCTISGNAATSGGGVYCHDSSPMLTNCTITGNKAGRFGGGVGCHDSSPMLTNCTITGNSASGVFGIAGGPGCPGGYGGGVDCSYNSSPTLSNCTISGNTTLWGGGGVSCDWDSSPTLIYCTISGNTTLMGGGTVIACRNDGEGGGVYGGSPTLSNCTISGNMASYGGGVYGDSPTLTNCTISGNAARDNGGGVYCPYGSSPTLTDCTIVGNTGGGISCESSSPTLTGCILWANGVAIAVDEWGSSCPTVTHSCVEGELPWPGEGNTNRDPLFVRAGRSEECGIAGEPGCVAYAWNDLHEETAWHRWIEGDYHLQPGSPCIDAGTSMGAPTTDLDGRGRPCGAGVDMGVYEAGDCAAPTERFMRGDANHDGALNIADAVFTLQFLFARGDQPSCLDSADGNDDGRLDVADVITTLGYLFAQAGAIPGPRGACGIDPTLDVLGCIGFSPCAGP
jgi:parallel beta-helix repeat protein